MSSWLGVDSASGRQSWRDCNIKLLISSAGWKSLCYQVVQGQKRVFDLCCREATTPQIISTQRNPHWGKFCLLWMNDKRNSAMLLQRMNNPYTYLQGDCKWMDPPIQKGKIMILLCTEIKNFCTWLTGMKKLIFYFNRFFCSGHFWSFCKIWWIRKMTRAKKICLNEKSVFSCLSSTRRNFWNSFIQRLYFQNCYPELPIAPTVSFLWFFCRKLAQWLLRTYYFLKWVPPSEFPLVELR